MRFALAAALALAATVAAAQPPELRGLWVVRTGLVSPAAVDRVVDQALAGGLNALFVQVRGRGDAFYRSSLVPRSPLLARSAREFDPLLYMIERARANGLEVHAWVNVLLAAPFRPEPAADHVVARHPDWVMVPRLAARASLPHGPRGLLWLVRRAAAADPDAEGFYLSASSPGAVGHLEGVVRELLRGYAVDGLHLDFIRYPGPEYDYSVAALEGFRNSRGGEALLEGPAAYPWAWEQYRRATLTALADRLARAARAERPGLRVSAAVVPEVASAVHQKYQDWPAWLARGILDAVCPMAYTPDAQVFAEQVREARARAGAAKLWAGIGAYRLDLPAIVERIAEARAAGADGVVLFSHESLAAVDLRALRAATIGNAGVGRGAPAAR